MSSCPLSSDILRQVGRLIAGACLTGALAIGFAAAPPATGAALAQAPAGGPVVPVSTATATKQDVPVILTGLGSVQAYETVLVRARVDGTLNRVAFTEGQEVHPGDLLAVIDPRPYQAVLEQAVARRAADVAQLANARADLARTQSLAQSSFASRQSLDTQRALVDQLLATIQGDDATIAQAKLNLDFTRITSPIEGKVGLKQVDAGNIVHASDTNGIVTITQIRPISVVFTLPQDNLPAIIAEMRKGKLTVQAWSADDRTKLGTGTLLTTDNAIDPATGTIRLKATFPNQEESLWPGQFVNARLLLRTLPNVLTVPSLAVQRGPGGLFVYVVKPDSTVGVQPVEVAQDDGTTAVISKGLDEGTAVVTAGQSRIQNGSKVSVTNAKAAS
jgi:multidrug efflux system membrane fusion protein